MCAWTRALLVADGGELHGRSAAVHGRLSMSYYCTHWLVLKPYRSAVTRYRRRPFGDFIIFIITVCHGALS